MKTTQKVISLVLVTCFIILAPINTWAATTEENVFELNIEQYFSLSDEGIILFDVITAEQNGVNMDIINNVANQIDKMNQLVINGDAYVTDDYSVVQYLAFSRATGENKVVTHWWGLTEIYMDSAKADKLYNDLSSIGGNYTDATYESIFEESGINIGLYLLSAYYINYAWQVGQAKAAGKGIIMNIQTDLVYGGQSIWFISQ